MSGISTDETTHDEEGEHLHPYLHLHDGNGHVIHRHKPALTLAEFLRSNLAFDFTYDISSGVPYEDSTPLRLFVNGKEVQPDPQKEILEYVFQDLDTILITDAKDPAEVQRELQQMTDDACLYSQTCPERGKPPAENCISDPAIPCVEPTQ